MGGGMSDVAVCVVCEEPIDLESDSYYYSETKDGHVCESCEQSDMERASNVILFNADGTKERVLVSDLFVKDAEYWEDFDRVKMTREWKSTDGWRGYFDTTIEGYEEIKDLTGWTTGWVDETVGRKATLNEWLEEIYESEERPEIDFAVISEQTSNVFSMAISVWVKEGQREQFVEWLGEEYGVLTEALG
jgi:hypothetical protein